jgi:phosphatidylserine/phosphatidylglycerophosphate/cardiolipin synthase-like enzyme
MTRIPLSSMSIMADPVYLGDVSAGTLKLLAAAFRSGQLTTAITPFALERVTACPPRLADDLQRLVAEGMSGRHLALVLDLAASTLEARFERDTAAELVWSGPETPQARCRDTRVVVDGLFDSAEKSVLVSTYVIQGCERVFAALAARLDAIPALSARIFLNVERKAGDTRLENSLLGACASDLCSKWPGGRRPEIYYDPRGLSPDSELRASWHAKCVVVDDEVAFVTSANFTEWAQDRNAEAGVLIRSRHFAVQLRRQMESLIESKQVKRLLGF